MENSRCKSGTDDCQTKCCRECKTEKPFDFFAKKKKGKHGINTICKKCANNKCKVAYLNNPEMYKEIRIKKNPEKLKVLHKNWVKKNPEKVKILTARYYEKNKEEVIKRNMVFARKYIDTLSDIYVAEKLKRQGFTKNEILQYPELVEVKRLTIKIQRLCKTSQI